MNRRVTDFRLGVWLLDKRLKNKRLDIRIEGLEDSSLFAKLGKKAQRQEGALGILVLESAVRKVDSLIQVQLGSVHQDYFRLPVECVKPMRSVYKPGYVEEHTSIGLTQTRVVIIGPDINGDVSKIGEYAQVDPIIFYFRSGGRRVVKVVFARSAAQEHIETGYYDAGDLCRSLNESIEWQGFPIHKTSFL